MSCGGLEPEQAFTDDKLHNHERLVVLLNVWFIIIIILANFVIITVNSVNRNLTLTFWQLAEVLFRGH